MLQFAGGVLGGANTRLNVAGQSERWA